MDLFVKSEQHIHRTFYFDTKSNPIENYTLGFAFRKKKKRFETKIEHQLTTQIHRPTRNPFKKYWYPMNQQDNHKE